MKRSVSREVEFDAGHRVPNHLSKCASPHGHRYRVRATWEGELVADEDAPDHGMVVDFSELKRLLVEYVHDVLDHGFIVERTDTAMLEALEHVPGARVMVLAGPPTAEVLAAWVWGRLASHTPEDVRLVRVELWETPTSLAVVER